MDFKFRNESDFANYLFYDDIISEGDHCDPASDEYVRNLNLSVIKYCPSHWDSFLCWPASKIGMTAEQPCPEFLGAININATKYCKLNGTWDAYTDFLPCLPFLIDLPPDNGPEVAGVDHTLLIYRIGYSVTIVALVAALYIFFRLRSLWCLRNYIHCNLMMALLLFCICWLVFYYNLDTLTLCPHLWIVSTYFQTAFFFWMSVEGFYVCSVTVWTFSTKHQRLRYYVIFGWVTPLILTVVWVALKLNRPSGGRGEDKTIKVCPFLEKSSLDYIIQGTNVALISVNAVFFVTIIWVVLSKVSATATLETKLARKVARGTAALIPLLGIPYLFLIDTPYHTAKMKEILQYPHAVIQGTQGVWIATVYCFLNAEVQEEIRRKVSVIQDKRTLKRSNPKSKSSGDSLMGRVRSRLGMNQGSTGVDKSSASYGGEAAARDVELGAAGHGGVVAASLSPKQMASVRFSAVKRVVEMEGSAVDSASVITKVTDNTIKTIK